MIKTLALEEVRGLNETFTFDRLNVVTGRNGARKSTLKEALCYLYAGMDSDGRPSPKHLITKGADSLRITLTNDRGVALVRTLTQKGSQNCSILRADVRTPLSQTELTSLLGASPDAFLSIFVPGFFMRLPAGRQQGVLSEVLPAVDRVQLLSEIAGFELADHEKGLIDFSKRADLAGSRLTEGRRQWQRELDQKRGKLAQLRTQAAAPTAPALKPEAELARLDQLEKLKEIWRDYTHRVNAYVAAKSRREHVEQRNVSRVQEAEAVRAELTTMVMPVVRVVERQTAKIREMEQLATAIPAEPAYHTTVAGDRCPACGQVVGSKHRAQVAADNAKLHADWEQARIAVVAKNAELHTTITQLRDRDDREMELQRQEQVAYNRAHQRKAQLEAKLSTLTPEALPDLLPEPTKPEEKYDEKEVDSLRVVKGNYFRAVGAHDAAVRAAAAAAGDADRLDGEVTSLQGHVTRAESLESALQRLPQEELARQSNALRLGGYRLGVGDEGLTFATDDGWTYRALSTGLRMLADVHLSLKLNELLRAKTGRGVTALFLDDKDLLDHMPDVLQMPGLQVFVAHVAPGEGLSVTTTP